MDWQKFIFLAAPIAAALVLAGCLSGTNNADLASSKAAVAQLNDKCNALEGKNAELQQSLAQSLNREGDCDKRITAAKAETAQARQEYADGLQAIRASIVASKVDPLNSSRANAEAKYADISALACRYYLGYGGWLTGSNVTVPNGCALYLDAYINASNFYIQQVKAQAATPDATLALIDNLTASANGG
ncbi:hypothetical protein HY995_03470 [Candidatus Micrarchaeota archaeon]|nr:hypothetical protein [Candidatus Micrarchaeota archaeon]MBI5177119.1 hypothetical protein [Candidatus Micrarchaeota archaeon]